MTHSKRGLVLLLSLAGVLAGGERHSLQDVAAKDNAADAGSKVAGVWRGHSECAVKNSPCHDEVNVYRFSKIPGRGNTFSVTASKVVDGKEVVMGTSDWKYDEKKQVIECEKPSIQLTIDGEKMEGALKLEDGTVYRRVYLKKEG
ncbi:MAG TPA: hypothetical protein VJN89_18890 [Candidatus Acidoferrum sp.]|nr:hypothetical protein [Candidatus Acidoferrum sp.]